MNAFDVRSEVLSWLPYVPKEGEWIPSKGIKGVTINLINACVRIDDGAKEANIRRHRVLAWIFRDVLENPCASEISTKELTDEMWWALCMYVDARKSEDTGTWIGKDDLCESMHVCLCAMDEWEAEMNSQLGFSDML